MRTKTLLFAAALLAACSTTEHTTDPEPARDPEAGVAKKIAFGAKIEVFGAT